MYLREEMLDHRVCVCLVLKVFQSDCINLYYLQHCLIVTVALHSSQNLVLSFKKNLMDIETSIFIIGAN